MQNTFKMFVLVLMLGLMLWGCVTDASDTVREESTDATQTTVEDATQTGVDGGTFADDSHEMTRDLSTDSDTISGGTCPRVVAAVQFQHSLTERWWVSDAFALADGGLVLAGDKDEGTSIKTVGWMGVYNPDGQARWVKSYENPTTDPDSIWVLDTRLHMIEGEEALLALGSSPPARWDGDPRVLWVSLETGDVLARSAYESARDMVPFRMLDRSAEVASSVWYEFDSEPPANGEGAPSNLVFWSLFPGMDWQTPAFTILLANDLRQVHFIDQKTQGSALLSSTLSNWEEEDAPTNSQFTQFSDDGTPQTPSDIRLNDHSVNEVVYAVPHDEGSIALVRSRTPPGDNYFDILSLDSQGQERWRYALGSFVYEWITNATIFVHGANQGFLSVVIDPPIASGPLTLWQLDARTGQLLHDPQELPFDYASYIELTEITDEIMLLVGKRSP